MTSTLSILSKKVNDLIQQDFSILQTLKGICFELSDAIETNLLLVDKNGKVICMELLENDKMIFDTKEVEGDIFVEHHLNDQFRNIVESKTNISLNSFYIKNTPKTEIKKAIATIIPMNASNDRIGTLVLYKTTENYTVDEISVAEICGVIISLISKYSQNEESAEGKRKINVVKSAIGTLSYSELEAVLHIFNELEGNEGLLVASKIADRVGITRSVIVNALRKLESAGVIESRSLGMKGTYIKVLNGLVIEELDKLRS